MRWYHKLLGKMPFVRIEERSQIIDPSILIEFHNKLLRRQFYRERIRIDFSGRCPVPGKRVVLRHLGYE